MMTVKMRELIEEFEKQVSIVDDALNEMQSLQNKAVVAYDRARATLEKIKEQADRDGPPNVPPNPAPRYNWPYRDWVASKS